MRLSSSILGGGLLASMLVIGCGDSPSEPTSDLDGTWRGTITRAAAAGTITLQMTQSGAGVTGTWSADLDGVAFDQSGAIGGTVAGSSASLFLTPSSALACSTSSTLSGTLTMNGSFGGDRLTGNYVVFTCDGVDTGRIEVVRD